MKSWHSWREITVSFCAAVFAAVPGCDVQLGNWSQAKYERTTSRQVARGTSTTIDVATQSGSIHITGADVNDCNVVAAITGYAPTEEEAQELAEQAELTLEPVGNTLKVRVSKPTLLPNRSISTSYTLTVPRRMNVRCDSDYGRLDVSNIEGTVQGRTSNGSIEVGDVQGTVNLNTSYGSITCRRVVGGTTTLRSSNGSIAIEALKGPAEIETSYGSITCREYSDGDLRLKSSNGRITLSGAVFGKCDASTSYGSVFCSTLKGESIQLHSDNGHVELADAEAAKVGLSTSYGGIKARQITMPDLTAHSGSGGIEIVCSPSTPATLVAKVTDSYGDIHFTAPAGFSGRVDLSTDYGSIRTALPVTVTGEVNKKRVTGRIGEGTGMLHLETGNGSIELK